MTTMLEIIQQATAEMSLPVPTYVAGNTQAQVIQLLALLNGAGRKLTRKKDSWQALCRSYIFTVDQISLTGDTTTGVASITNASTIVGVNATYQVSGPGINQATYVEGTPSGSTIGLSQPATANTTTGNYTLTQVKFSMPSDYDRMIDRTHWDKSKHWEMLGPETPQQWEWLISGYISTGPRVRWRIFGNYFQIWGTPAEGEVLGFEYVSKAWCYDSLGAPKNSFTADTDTCIFSDQLMVLALKHEWFILQGFADRYAEEYAAQLSEEKANDSGSPTLSMNPRISTVLIGWDQIPDSGYGS